MTRSGPWLWAVMVLYGGISAVGITWGLPSRAIDRFLFGEGEAWSGEKIYRLAGAQQKFSPDEARGRGADVDVDPLAGERGQSIPLTASDEDVAKIHLRYRLYTSQPDEMITMMALAGMRPGDLQFDPRIYQYGGLFIYPVGALLKLCGILGWIELRQDVVYYLDNPDEFGKFYVVARAYSAAWGLVGVFVVFAIARRIEGDRAGILSALLFAVMPVVVCLSHEGKPHLPGAVLIVTAVLFAMQCVARNRAASESTGVVHDRADSRGPKPEGTGYHWWWMCVCCGAATGMVLSSWPVFVLIPLVAYFTRRSALPPPDGEGRVSISWLRPTAVGVAIGGTVYLVTNPYIVINLLANRAVLASNFGNSLAMYEVSRVVEGLVRVVELTIEGATLPVLATGAVAMMASLRGRRPEVMVLLVPAGVFFVQFVLIGAGKPAEYGRFGIFPSMVLAIGAACGVRRATHRLVRSRWACGLILAGGLSLWSSWRAIGYLRGFVADAGDRESRLQLASSLAELAKPSTNGRVLPPLITFAEPAPYCFPPVDFARVDVRLVPLPDHGTVTFDPTTVAVGPLETSRTPISWADKDFFDSRRGVSIERDAIPLGR